MATVLITGGSGMIGSALAKALIDKHHDVIILSRKASNNNGAASKISHATWNVNKQHIDEQAIKDADFIVHLAGTNIAQGRWTDKRKQEIVDSRVKTGELLVKALRETPNKVKAVISASAIGWYGPDPVLPNPKPFVESDPADNTFLGSTSQKWEAAIKPVVALGKRLVTFRIGIVLSREGGAYAEFHKPLQFGLASILGSGKQIISWIHIDDLVRLFINAVENESLNGVYNAVAPNPVSNGHLIKQMAKVKGGFSIAVPVPAFVLKAMLGEMSIEVLKSATVSSVKVQDTGFFFSFPTIEQALENLNKKAP
ncbi:TIGR01777 family oxidoreductase [Flavisolibacter tropicus]|uniref:Epimerase n=1 Tax=Flavisolibacter tropicus TaxID=1492898 RepID=A0A172TU69_9BACT|nr:TIGR01777 family oxidoreductase [Flavisolibacter tropicus]ANE50542.1 hypothetical protein SY85_08535 [Flavisolibacter tropicus]